MTTTLLAISAAYVVLAVLVLSMVPPWQFRNWQWLALTLAAPVAVWGALPFHRAAWTNLRLRGIIRSARSRRSGCVSNGIERR